MSINKVFFAIAILALIGWGCKQETAVAPRGNDPVLTGLGAGDTIHLDPDTICGSIVTGRLVDANGNYGSGNMFGADVYGDWRILASPSEIIWQISCERGWAVNKWWAWAEDAVNIPVTSTGTINLEQLPWQSVVYPQRNTAEVRVPITAANTCPASSDMILCLELIEMDFLGNPYNNTIVWAEGSPVSGASNGQSVSFCAVPCGSNNQPVPCDLNAGEFRTQTQGGWGSNANGNNPGAYRDANFAAAFPAGLVVGCNNTLTLTNATAVKRFLPCGGPAGVLSQNYTDPNNLKNVLAGQIVAAKLSIGFDKHDANFGTSAQRLENLVLAEGDFQGWTVGQLVQEADRAIGGCGSSYSFSALNEGLTRVNENFVDGTLVGQALSCPSSGGSN